MPKKKQWNEIPCPACKEPAAYNATRCPHCQIEFTAQQVEERKSTLQGGIGCAIVLLVGLVGSLTMCTGGNDGAVPDAPSPSAKADAVSLFKEVMRIAGPCDTAASLMAEAGQKQDLLGTIRGAQAMRDQCLSVPGELRKIEVPQSVGRAAHDVFKQGIESCEAGYLARWSAAGEMITALDGGGKPSRLIAIEDGLESSKTQLTYCSGLLVSAAAEVGATSKDLGLE